MAIATVEINLSALLHNTNYLKSAADHCNIMAILKANAYGHGMVEVARCLQGSVEYFGVARLSEALHLRRIGVLQPILLLEGFFLNDDLSLLTRYGLQTVIHCPEQIDRLKRFKTKQPITAWFKIDSGMHRLGFRPEEALFNLIQLAACESIAKPIHIITHFCSADELCNSYTLSQIQFVEQFIADAGKKGIPLGYKSFAASGGFFGWPTSHQTVVRPGISLYGVSPFPYDIEGKAKGSQLGLVPVMTLKSELIAIRGHLRGEGVGYNQIWHSKRDTKLGVVAMGYGDGYPRNVPPGTPVLVNGLRVPIVGRVSMDMTVIDLGPESNAKIGDEVIFWGPLLPVEEVAAFTGYSAYELLTTLTNRTTLLYKPKLISS